METDNGPTEVPGVGDQLARAREAMGRSREAMAHELRLTVDQITNLETEAFHRMPAEAYVRGHLRNYAAALGLDPDQVLRAYERSSGDQPSQKADGEEGPLIPEPERPLLEHPWRVAIISLLLVVVVSAVTIYLVDSKVPSGPGAVAEDDATSAPDEAATTGSDDEGGDGDSSATEPGRMAQVSAGREAESQGGQSEEEAPGGDAADAETDSEPSPTASDGRDETDASSGTADTDGAPSAEQEGATQPAGGEADGDASGETTGAAEGGDGDAADEATEPADRSISADKPAGMSTLRVRTWQDAWIRVTDAGGDQLVERVVPGGKDLRLFGEPPFRAKVGNAAGVQLYFDGTPLASLGGEAEVVTVTVDDDSETIPESEVGPPQGGGEAGG